MRQRAWIASLVFAIAGCLVQRGRAEPLYPVSGERLPPERVAQLDGYIRKVDDKQIDQGINLCDAKFAEAHTRAESLQAGLWIPHSVPQINEAPLACRDL